MATERRPTAPKVSIGLPIYNGARYLRKAIDSILAQTFQDFELIISDNASTDATAEICRDYARDPRVRYSRTATNVGGANNANLTFRLSRGQYFRWAAHDDVLADTLLERCVEVLDRRPEVVLSHTSIIEINESGGRTGDRTGREGTFPTPHERFRHLSDRWHPCDAIYGLVRSDILRQTRLHLNYTDSDRVLLCELALHGPFALIEEPLFFKRFHGDNRYRDWRGRMAWFDPSLRQSGRATYPNWLQLFDLLRTIRRVPLPWRERWLCRLSLERWLLKNTKGLAWDLVVAGMMSLHSRQWRVARYADERWR